MIIDSFKVVAATTDITDLITGMTFFESVNGMLQGNIQMLDGQNFFDLAIGEQNRLIPIEVELTYLRRKVAMAFMIDGINQMKIFKQDELVSLKSGVNNNQYTHQSNDSKFEGIYFGCNIGAVVVEAVPSS